MKMRKLSVILGAILVLLVATSIQSFAQEVIYGCCQKNNGQLRIVSDPNECRRSEIPISWYAAERPQGEQGPPGLHCWDLDGDHECSDAEDINDDGVCDAYDCQGVSGVQTGEITGTIDFCDEAGPDDGILVYIPGESFMVKTGPSGAFAFRSVPPGSYDLMVEIPGEEPFSIGDVEVLEGETTELGTTSYCFEQRTFIAAYYTTSDDDGQAAFLDSPSSILIDGTVNSYINLGPNYTAESIGGDLGSALFVSKIRMYGDTDSWSDFRVLYNTENTYGGWTEVENLTVTKYIESGGLDGTYTNELSFDPVSARWWKVIEWEWSHLGSGI
jgi:hypothetical protein